MTEHAAKLLVVEYAETLASSANDRATVALEPLDDIELCAARSIGRYPGLSVRLGNVPSARRALSKIAM